MRIFHVWAKSTVTIAALSIVLVSSSAKAETQQRIDYYHSGLGPFSSDYVSYLAELNLSSHQSNRRSFWLRVVSEVRVDWKVSEYVYTKEFPLRQYIAILRRFQTAGNLASPTAHRSEFLCDSIGYSVRFNNLRQSVNDYCGPAPEGVPPVDPHITDAVARIRRLIAATVRSPTTSYRRR